MFFHLCSPVKTIKIHLPFRQIFFLNPDNIKKPWQSSHLLSFCNYLQSSTRKYDQKFVSTSVCLHEQSTKTVRNCFKERLLDVDFDVFLMIFFLSIYERLNQLLTGWNVVCLIDLEYNIFVQEHFYMIIQPFITINFQWFCGFSTKSKMATNLT